MHGRGHEGGPGETFFKAGRQAVRVPGSGVHGQAGWLAENDQLIRLRDDGRQKGTILFYGCGGLRPATRKRRHAHLVTKVHTVEGLGPTAVDAYLPGPYPAMQHALRLVKAPGQKLQELLARFLRRHKQWLRHKDSF